MINVYIYRMNGKVKRDLKEQMIGERNREAGGIGEIYSTNNIYI